MILEYDANHHDHEDQEFVPVAFAEDEHQAEVYRQTLSDHGIEALVGYEELEQYVDPDTVAGEMSSGIPLFVDEACLDEASEIISERADIDEFDPLELEEDSGDDSDEDMLDSELTDTGGEFGYASDDNDDESAGGYASDDMTGSILADDGLIYPNNDESADFMSDESLFDELDEEMGLDFMNDLDLDLGLGMDPDDISDED